MAEAEQFRWSQNEDDFKCGDNISIDGGNNDRTEEEDEEEESSLIVVEMPSTKIRKNLKEEEDDEDSEGQRNTKTRNEVAMNGSQVYVDEWKRLFVSSNYPLNLKEFTFQGELRSCRFRSVCWKVFLKCLPKEQSEWKQESRKHHEHYRQLKSKFIINPRSENGEFDPFIDNPLSQEETSPWNQFFQDSELKITIQQDVDRTFPEVEFFQSKEIRNLMINILFCYAREHPQVSYRQGMHELLAPLVFVLHSDMEAFKHAVEIDFIEETVKCVLDSIYLEPDAYCMFSRMMDNVESWYHVHDVNQSKFSHVPAKPFPRPQDANAYTVVISKLNYIHDFLLKRHDQELYCHLERMEIAPQIFGIRWLRLLFGREFALQDLLVIWDVIFADERNFGLVDYIFISMLLYIKSFLLTGDYATCLGYLMRYPAVVDVHYIIDMALHIREPLKFKKPTGYNQQMLQHVPTVGGRPDIHRAPVLYKNDSMEHQKGKAGNKMMSGLSTLTRKMTNSRPKTLNVVPRVHTSSSSSVRPKDTSKSSSSDPASFESRSPSPDLAEYAQIEVDYDAVYVDRDTIAKSNPALAANNNTETEMRPLGARFKDRASTLPRSHANNGGSGVFIGRRESLQDVEMNRVRVNHYGSSGIVVGEEIPTFATNFVRNNSRRNSTQRKNDVYRDVAQLQGQLSNIESMCNYCSHKMTTHIDRLQECIVKQTLEDEDEMLIALAGMKQVRDILKGTLKFSHNFLDGENMRISDDHYPKENIGRMEASGYTNNNS